jgi:hypothetical protein
MKQEINKQAIIELFESKLVDSYSTLSYDYRDSINMPLVSFPVSYDIQENDDDPDDNFYESEMCDMTIFFNADGYFLTFRNIEIQILNSEYKKLLLLFKKHIKKYETKSKKEEEENDFHILNDLLSQKVKSEKRNILFEKTIGND